ncbi:MAG: hypothetical protein ACOC3T_05300 [Bacteroidota bacterium]
MYVFFQILFSVILAIIVAGFFYYAFKFTGPWGSFWTFLLILILAGVAASNWVQPFGPAFYEIAWAPILLVILIFALLLAAATPTRYRTNRPPGEAVPEEAEEELPVLAISAIFWVFLLALMIAAVIGLFR